jgi:hypothetical protein
MILIMSLAVSVLLMSLRALTSDEEPALAFVALRITLVRASGAAQCVTGRTATWVSRRLLFLPLG